MSSARFASPVERIVQGPVAELGLALLAFADVLDVDDLVLDTACGGRRPRDADRHPDLAPIHAAEAAFVAQDPQFVREHHRAVMSGVVDIVGMDHVVEGATEQRGRVGADQLAQRRVAGDDHTVQPGHGHAHRRVVERAVHGRVQGARREGRHLRSYPRVACGRLWPDPADSDVVTTFVYPQVQMHVHRCVRRPQPDAVAGGAADQPFLSPERGGHRSAAQACGGHAQQAPGAAAHRRAPSRPNVHRVRGEPPRSERGPRGRDVVRLGEEADVRAREVDQGEPGPGGARARATGRRLRD